MGYTVPHREPPAGDQWTSHAEKSHEPGKQVSPRHVHLERLYPDVDVAETLSCVTGQRIRRLAAGEVELENGERFSLADPPWEAVKPLIWW
mgnify:CR=1 FL=1